MNFFEHQHRAHRQSLLLIVLFLIAVTLFVTAVCLVVAYVYWYGSNSLGFGLTGGPGQLGPGFFVLVSTVTLLIIFGATLWKMSQLSKGGRVVAEMLGGERVDPSGNDPAKRRLINVVEEMAIASGTPVPAIYLLETDGINAFAAGFSPSQAVIGVTRGCMELLSRDELQGVIAHEFSHILNGDMRLNMRLIGVLHGILVIGLLGQALMRGTFKRSRYRYRYLDSDPVRRRGNGGAWQTFLAGLALMTVGYFGVLMGNLIKAALSRQREFLADASAVQFTRDADGIANALRKIRSHVSAARLNGPNSEQMSHLFFGEAVKSGFTNLLSTHPPLDERIRRIRPRLVIDRDPLPGAGIENLRKAGEIPRFSGFAADNLEVSPAAFSGLRPLTADEVVESVGSPLPEHLLQAKQLHEAVPPELAKLIHQPAGARALLLALLLEAPLNKNSAQQKLLAEQVDAASVERISDCYRLLERLPIDGRLPVLDMALPTMTMLNQTTVNEHLALMRQLLMASRPIGLSEYAVFAISRAQLAKPSKPGRRIYHRRLQPLIADVAIVAGLLARVGHVEVVAAERAYTAAMAKVGVTGAELPTREVATASALDKSLRRLVDLALMPKMKLISALATAVLYDEEVRIEELELLRAICEILDCPLPPLPAAVLH